MKRCDKKTLNLVAPQPFMACNDEFLHEKAPFVEKPYMQTTFLHDIGLFVEKYLSASSIKSVRAFRLSLHTLDAMPGGRISRAWCLIEQLFALPLGRLLPDTGPSGAENC